MDIQFSCYLSYLVVVYLLGLALAIVLNAYTFYTYGRVDCDYSLELYRQSIAGIFGGLFTGLLLITVLIIPDSPPTNNQANKSYARSIMAFTILFIISALLTSLETYLFVSNQLYNWTHELGSCHRTYYDAVYATTILSIVPVYLIALVSICLIIGQICGCLDKCCQSKYRDYYRLPTTNRNTQTNPEFINAETYCRANITNKTKSGSIISRQGSNSSDDDVLSLDGTDFTFDAPELQLSNLITSDNLEKQRQTNYPSRKYQYPTTETSTTQLLGTK